MAGRFGTERAPYRGLAIPAAYACEYEGIAFMGCLQGGTCVSGRRSRVGRPSLKRVVRGRAAQGRGTGPIGLGGVQGFGARRAKLRASIQEDCHEP